MSKIYYEKPKHRQNPQDKVKGSAPIGEQQGDPKNKIKNLIANIVLVVLSIALVVNVAIAIGIVNDMNRIYVVDEDDFWYYISEGRYTEMVTNTWQNRAYEVDTEGTTLEQCYAVAEYFEAASLYKVAEELGNEEDKAKYKAIMEDKLTHMGDILYVAEDINAKLEIE